MTIERRFSEAPTAVQGARVTSSRTATPMITGYAALFHVKTTIANTFVEVIRPGAFRDALADNDTVGLFNHSADWVLGRTTAGTLRLAEDDRGLKYWIDINPDDPMAMSVLARIRRGDVRGSSFGFSIHPDDERWSNPKGSPPLHTILRVSRLFDVSPVTYPVYPQTSVGAQDSNQ
jgi:HK97 family phage prohead protease